MKHIMIKIFYNELEKRIRNIMELEDTEYKTINQEKRIKDKIKELEEEIEQLSDYLRVDDWSTLIGVLSYNPSLVRNYSSDSDGVLNSRVFDFVAQKVHKRNKLNCEETKKLLVSKRWWQS